jgi:hypothetical protein
MNDKVKNVLNTIIEKFKSGDIPEAVALATFPIPNTPSANWSFTNRTLMFISGTGDARGFRQWKEVNRWVKKGSTAIHILVPCFTKKVEESGEDDVLAYFKPTPVFRFEDTEGDALDHENVKLPNFPLVETAESWGISVNAIPGNYLYRGYYSPGRHEIAHASHEKVKGNLKAGQDPLQEIIAELSAQALCRLVGKRTKETLGNTYRYIERYAKKVNLKPYNACLRVLSETEKILNTILQGGSHAKGQFQA